MGTTNYPKNYLNLNQQTTKKLNVVVQFQGIDTIFSLVPIYQKIRYGDPRIHYGDPGIVYGGLIAVDNVEPILMVDGGLNITQQIEPEQGRGSVATLNLNFIDKDGIMTKLISQNSLVPEPLVNILVTVSLGFTNSSFPEDYYKVFRGYITNITSTAGMVSLELSDANIKRRQTIFLGGTSALGIDIDNSTTTIPVITTSGFIDYIVGPRGTVTDAGSPLRNLEATWDYLAPPYNDTQFGHVTAYILIDQEFMAYAPTAFSGGSPQFTTATWSIGVPTVTVVNPFGIIPGMEIAASVPGIPANTTILNVSGNTLTLSNNTTTNQGSGINVSIYPTITVLSRGGSNSRGTSPDVHTAGTAVTNNVQFTGNVIDLALRIMLSGFDGPWMTGVPITALGTSLDPSNVQNAGILFPAAIDVVDDYGLVIGDFIQINGSTAGNDGSYTITDIQDDLGDSNRLVIVDRNLNIENPASSVTLDFRSQFDTFPKSCGLLNTPQDLDVTTHVAQKNSIFNQGYTEQLFISDTQNGQSGKDTIEGTLWLPVGIYTITRYGRISLAVTLPPIAGQGMVFLDETNVLEPDKIRITRATNKRRFYNVIQYNYDLDDQGNYHSQNILIDETSPNPIDIESVLPINADALKTILGAAPIIQGRGLFILNRYKKAAFEITLKVNWSAASVIEVGDIIALQDNGQLQISNLETGVRNLGIQLFEVIQRQLNVKEGFAQLTLLSNTGYQINQRFGTISPSSIVASGSTNSTIQIQDSYGPIFPGDEQKKWLRLFGLPIQVHNSIYTQSATTILTGFSGSDPYQMQVSPPLPFAPSGGMIVDIVGYSLTDTNPQTNSLYKTLFAHIDPTLTVLGATAQNTIQVSLSDAALANVGLPIFVHDAFYNQVSSTQNVQSINLSTGVITTVGNLGFTASSGMKLELVGWKDGLGAYLIL